MLKVIVDYGRYLFLLSSLGKFHVLALFLSHLFRAAPQFQLVLETYPGFEAELLPLIFLLLVVLLDMRDQRLPHDVFLLLFGIRQAFDFALHYLLANGLPEDWRLEAAGSPKLGGPALGLLLY